MIPDFLTKVFPDGRRHSAGLLIALAMGLPAVSIAQADNFVFQSAASASADLSLQTVSETNLTVTLLSGLLSIERDMLLGQLFLQDGLVSTEGSHFTHPRKELYSTIKEDLLAAGVPDLEPLLIALEGATDKIAVNEAYLNVIGAVKLAKQTLKPADQDLLAAMILTTEEAAAMIDASGTTDIIPYQESWGLLMIARSALDTLMGAEDPAVKKSAEGMAAAFEGVIMALPDPAASAPVVFDPAILQALIAVLNGSVSET